MLSLREVLKLGTDILIKKKVGSPVLESEYLLAFVLRISRLEILFNQNRVLNRKQVHLYRGLIERRIKGYPLAYLLGEQDFMGLKFELNSGVLIPRPETEILTEKVMERIKKFKTRNLRIVDVGTGSGNIVVSLAKYLSRPKFYATEISRPALNLARQNAKLHKVAGRIRFLKGNLLRPLSGYNLEKKINCIISNPPYVEKEKFYRLPTEVQKEPRLALDGGKNGLYFYPRIIEQSKKYLSSDGFLALEIGWGQRKKIVSLLEQGGLGRVEVIKDYAGVERVIFASGQ